MKQENLPKMGLGESLYCTVISQSCRHSHSLSWRKGRDETGCLHERVLALSREFSIALPEL